ncbi:hypothetical protein BG004_001232 [Podila humilis]|nr:hypothetical protein BG004_001232 [Podila humilis]
MVTHAQPSSSPQRKTKKQRIIVRHEKPKITTRHVMGLQHPLGIKPLGNYYMDASRPDFPGSCRGPSLGQLSRLTDELLVDILNLLAPRELLTLGATSRVLYGLTHLDDMWKILTIERFKGDWTWHGDTWRATFLKRSDPTYNADLILQNRETLKLKYFYSDVLFQPFYCAAIGMDPYVAIENIDRRTGLTLQEFIQEYERPGKPVIIQDGAENWPAMKKWSTEYFLKTWPEAILRAESVDMTMANYFKYSKGTKDESPLYLFDKNFGERCQGIMEDMEVPVYFREDFFGMMGENRPDYRWLIVGPARSGSTFHKDPNATSAWNAVITGSKKWIMFPPHILPPGVFTNEDESEVTSPVSLMEWFSNFYASTQFPEDPADRPLEGICREGEIMFVPRGWWHAVVNLEDCIAVTQNYVGSQNLYETMEFLYMKRDQVSGVADERREGLYEEFKKAFFYNTFSVSAEEREEDQKNVDSGSDENDNDAKSGDDDDDDNYDYDDEGLTDTMKDRRRKRLLFKKWVKNEKVIEKKSWKGMMDHTVSKDAVPEKLSFWEQAKLGGVDKSNNSSSGSTTLADEAPSTIGFSFAFGFVGDEEEEMEDEEEEKEKKDEPEHEHE